MATMSAPQRSSVATLPTRQQLDELDALLQRMLDLPVHGLDDDLDAALETPPPPPPRPVPPSRPSSISVRNSPRSLSVPAVSAPPPPQIVKETSQPEIGTSRTEITRIDTPRALIQPPEPTPRSHVTERVHESSVSAALPRPMWRPSPRIASPLPSAESAPLAESAGNNRSPVTTPEGPPFASRWQSSPVERTTTEKGWESAKEWKQAASQRQTPAVSTLAGLGQQVAVTNSAPAAIEIPAVTQPTLDSSTSANDEKPDSTFVATPPALRTVSPFWGAYAFCLRPLVWSNRIFDRCMIRLGTPGRWLRRSTGRAVLGWTGVLCLAVAAGIAVLDWINWTW